MNHEEKLLVEICQSFLSGKKLSGIEIIDWEKFFNLSRHHNLIGVCHCVFNTNKEIALPKETRRRFEDNFYDLVYRYEMQKNTLNDIRDCFTGSQTPFIPFKGSVLREYYPVPEARSMGDTDLLIRPCDRAISRKLLADAGFALYSSNDAVDEYKRNGMILEVHTQLFDSYENIPFADGFKNAVFDGAEGRLEDSYHFAYLIAHAASHLKYTGAGIRFVLDLAVMQKERRIDMTRVFKFLESAKLVRFSKYLLTVCFEWFGCGERYVENTDRLKHYLVSDGVFGSLKSSESATVSRLLQCGALTEDKDKNRSRARLALSLAFPPYKTLKKANYIHFLDGRPWLLPAAWFYRFCYNLKNNRSHMLRTVKNMDDEATSALVNEELDFLEEIGLYGI